MTTVAIDASNIISGGGLTHLVRMLTEARPAESGVQWVHVWTSTATARQLPKQDWLVLHSPSWCNAGLARRMWGQQLQLPAMIKAAGCEVLFSPGGTLPAWSPVPMVTMSQNMLPFEPDRAQLFGRWSWMRLKMRMLRSSQGRSFRRAQGLIFLSRYARDTVTAALGNLPAATVLIPHGIERRFSLPPRPQRAVQADRTLRLLYVSIQMPYKHHIELMEAVAQLRQRGHDVVLIMAGSNAGAHGRAVRHQRLALDPEQAFLQDLGHVDFERLHELYAQADAFVFASSCENLPNILIEAMAAGLPIACSKCGPMPEVLGDAGIYFDPESPVSVAQAIERLAEDTALAADLAQRAWDRSQGYSWSRCASDTFAFVSKLASLKT
jgi:glycosyltransferase involved in cell wall biosynthesis